MMPELKPAPCPNDSIVEACKPCVEAIDGTNSKGLVGPCKFCGSAAYLSPYNGGRNYQAPNSHPTGVSLECSNSKCCATMHRSQCWVDDAHTSLEEPQVLVDALMARWNTRPDGGDSLREALEWYGEQARLCRLIHSGWDAGRNALANDGGKRAQAALTSTEGKG